MTVTAKQLKDLISELSDDEHVVLRIRPAMSSLDEDTISLNKVTYTEVVYNCRMPSVRQEKRKHG